MLVAENLKKQDVFIQTNELLSSPLSNVRSVTKFLEQARALGPRIKPNLLGKFRNKNQEILHILSEDYKSRQPPIEKNKISVIIPVVENEKEFDGILKDLFSQIELLQEHHDYNVEIIVIINGKGQDTDAIRAFEGFARKNAPPRRTTLQSMEIKKQGKLVAFDHALDHLEKQDSFPEKVFFFDDDARIKDLCLHAMLNLFDEVPAVGARIAYRDPRNSLEAISQVQTRGHGPEKPGDDWLHGGAYALSAELIPLYHAYVHAFPGTIMNDVNWAQIMKSLKINYKLTKDPYLVLSSPKAMVDLWVQQNRWLQGLRQGIAFYENPKEVAPIPNVLAWKHLKEYVPNFPKVTEENIKNIINIYMKHGEIWEIPFFQILIFMANFLPKPMEMHKGKKIISIGGPPQNPYRQKGWLPPRDYEKSIKEKKYVPKTLLGKLVVQAREDGSVEFRDITKSVGKLTELTTIIGRGHLETRARHFHESVNAYFGFDRIHLAPVEIEDSEFEAAMEDLVKLNMQGVTVTVPLKEIAYEYIKKLKGRTHFLNDQVRKSGAVNTIINTGRGLVGANTDIAGFVGASNEAGVKLKGIDAAIVGCGGMGRAALIGLCDNGAQSVKLYDIDNQRALKVTREFKKMYPKIKIEAVSSIEQCLDGVSYVAQCSAVGMNSDKTPIPAELLKPTMTIIDAVYVPQDTQLIIDARASGCRTISGQKIVIHGGIEQVRLYLGNKITEDNLAEISKFGMQSIFK